METILEVSDLSIGFRRTSGRAVDGVGFSVGRGETVALVGESGSGKTLTCRAALRILPPGAGILGGRALFGAERADLLSMENRALRKVRGGRIAMIFQEPMSALSPLHTIGAQTAEVIRLHRPEARDACRQASLEVFERVGFPDPERAWRSYPFELSGGLRQRAMIAMAMSARPELLIADEPTTALDVTTQALVLNLIKELQAETGMGVLLVTHDLGVVANMADAVVVMRKGRVMESGEAEDVLGAPGHGYTRKLLDAAPMIPERFAPADRALEPEDPILEARGLAKTYISRRGGASGVRLMRALRDIDLSLGRGETLAVVGESGSGKSTFARLALAAEAPDPGGCVLYRAEPGAAPIDLSELDVEGRKAFRRDAQMVMQDPYAALSPRMTVREILTEPLEIHGIGDRTSRRERAAELLGQVGLDPMMIERYPHAFSGGQRQRLSIARALALEPRLVVLDEPTSALDVSVQAQILDLLERIREERRLTYLFITHDLAVAARLADRVAVMRQGRIVELAPPHLLFAAPRHPYTKALIAASPEPDMARRIDMRAVAAGAGDSAAWSDEFRFEDDAAPPLRPVEPAHMVRERA